MRDVLPAFTALLLCTALTAEAADTPKLPEGAGRATTQRLCGDCHNVTIFTKRRETRDGWYAVIEDMIRRGAKGEEEEWSEVAEYLVQNFSKADPLAKVNVNGATAKALESGLGIPPEQAAAVVRYREEKGNFKALEDLLKVPGIDARAIEAQKDRIDF